MKIAWQVEYYYKWNTGACATIDEPDEEDKIWFEEKGYECKNYGGVWAIVEKGKDFPSRKKMKAYQEKKEAQRRAEELLLRELKKPDMKMKMQQINRKFRHF